MERAIGKWLFNIVYGDAAKVAKRGKGPGANMARRGFLALS